MLVELLNPILYPLDPAKRLYWACLLSSLVLASIVVSVRTGRFAPREQLAKLFDRKYWFTKSTLTDVGLMFVNNALRVLVFLPAIGSYLAATLVVGRFLQQNFGDAPLIELPTFVIAVTFSLVFFIAEDASRFFLHYSMHRFQVLWRFHRVHHSAELLTPLTLFRVHPVESTLYFIRGVAVFGLVTGFFIWYFGRNLETIDILGVGVFGFLFNLAGANLRHTPIWLSFGKLERWFVSPAQHQLHHSRDHGHVNLGSALAIWDRLIGTNRPAGQPQVLTFGLAQGTPGYQKSAHSRVRQALTSVFVHNR